jgi:heme-degrading monooxygenase HmoA
MIGVLTDHWANPELVDAARALLERNGAAQSRYAGFGARQTLLSLTDPTKITTLVTWQSNEAYDAWRASSERAAAMTGAGELWAQPPRSERFEVAG